MINSRSKSQLIWCVVLFLLSNCNTPNKETYFVTPSVVYFAISKGTSFDTTVYVRNDDSKKLFVSEIATACGCMVGTIKDSTVLSNDSIPLKLTFTPNALDTGKVVRFISLRTNGKPPIRTIELRGTIN